jgi:hypothetical protein
VPARSPRLLALALAASLACSEAPGDAPQATRRYTFKTLSGISMGAIGAAFLAGTGDHAKELDGIASLGGPLDAAWFLGRLEHMQMGGFCPHEELVRLAETAPERLNDPAALPCMKPEKTLAYELPQDFNHWRFTKNGGTFDRSEYLDLFWDLSLAMGNPLFYNPESPVFPAKEITRENFTPELCDKPIVLKKFYNKEHNPEGKYDVITFCDGEEPVLYCDDAAKTPVDFCAGGTPEEFCAARGAELKSATNTRNADLYFARMGAYDPCFKHTIPASFELAVDYNGNGRRDYHEPVIANGHERFQDVGKDGCANDREDGKGGCTASGVLTDANGDDFDPVANPLGLEGNFLRDEGEPYEDHGLDGVADTGDFGEGDKAYTDGPRRKHWLETDFRQKYLRAGSTMPRDLDVYADGGIRDLFNFGFSADVLTSATRGLVPAASGRYTAYEQIPAIGGAYSDGYYDALKADFLAAGRNVFVRYGNETVSEADRRAGDGDHVGTPGQLINRFGTYARWMSAHWEPVLGPPVPIQAVSRRETVTFFSERLKATTSFDIGLPPGYDAPAYADKRYPVATLGHGYGMDAEGMANLSILIDTYMSHGDMLPVIYVYPSGRCCFVRADGTSDCREVDENGVELRNRKNPDGSPEFQRECKSGSFYVNRQGFGAGDDRAYAEALFEILAYVDAHYRTLAPVTVPTDRP